MRQRATIMRFNGDSVECELSRDNACSGCSQAKTCGAVMPFLRSRWRASRLLVATDNRFEIGQKVWVELDDKLFSQIQANAYGLPLAGLLFGATAMALFAQDLSAAYSDGLVLAGTLGGLIAGMWCAQLRSDGLLRLLAGGKSVLGGRLAIRPAND